MGPFTAYDGAELAHSVPGDGAPVVSLPGGPQQSTYPGDLGAVVP
ncbi:hypothetical protein ACFV2N_02345 [Streptomyces sp. NPDC059680]|nr:hypothetical protein [Streptomyces barringtoniae]